MRQVIQHFRIPSEFFVFFSEGIYYKSGPQPATGEHNRSQSVWSVSEATVKRLGAVTWGTCIDAHTLVFVNHIC